MNTTRIIRVGKKTTTKSKQKTNNIKLITRERREKQIDETKEKP